MNTPTLFAVLTASIILLLPNVENQCIDENGNQVDWFVISKLPILRNNHQFLMRRGLSYMYVTSSNQNANWVLSKMSINDSQSMVAQTLRPLYENSDKIQILYNDQPPGSSASSIYGHTKGVVIANETIGFWLIHSVPNFPSVGGYVYPSSATKFGQSFLCISLTGQALNAVGTQLMYNRPKIYKSIVPNGLNKLYPNLTSAARNVYVRLAPFTSKITFKSKNGFVFNSYAKTSQYGREIYAAWIAPDIKSDLQVEAWSNGVGELPSNCTSKFHVMDVSEIGIKLNSTIVNFKNSMDHSKWAVSDSNDKFICIGDLNRMAAQLLRGGGTVCFRSPALWNKYSKMVQDLQPCPRH